MIIGALTLENVLNSIDNPHTDIDYNISLEDAIWDVSEAFQNLATLENNLTVMEAAKIIKKAKAKPTKKKPIMKKKVVKKATTENDDPAATSTEPTPATDTTVPVGQMANVPVTTDPNTNNNAPAPTTTEPVTESVMTEAEIALALEGVEGVDWEWEYDDPAIATLEATAKEVIDNIIKVIKEIGDKIMNFFKGIFTWISGNILKLDKAWYDSNKKSYEDGLAKVSADNKITVNNYVGGIEKARSTIMTKIAVFGTIFDNMTKGTADEINKAAASAFGLADGTEVNKENITKLYIDGEPKETDLAAIKGDFDKAVKGLYTGDAIATWKKSQASAKQAVDKAIAGAKKATDNKSAIKANVAALKLVYTGIGSYFSVFMKIRNDAKKFMMAVGKLAGAKDSKETKDTGAKQ